MVDTFITSDILAINEHTIGWDAHSSFHKNDVSNDEVFNFSALRKTILASDDIHFFVSDLLKQLL